MGKGIKITGLSPSEVERSRAEHGKNELSAQKKRGFWSQLLESFGDPIIKILLIALALNVLFLFRGSDWYETAGIALAVFLATFVGTVSEYGSESAFERLKEDAEKVSCRVIRGGKILQIPKTELVVGDVILMEAGEKIPVDGVMIDGKIKVDQSALNGESKETEKLPGQAFVSDLASKSAVFCGSTVASGSGLMRAVLIGDQTLYGEMAQEISESTRESPLKVRLAALAKVLSNIGYVAAGAVAFADLFHQIFIDSMGNLSAALAIMTTPRIILPHLLHAATLAITVIVVAVPEGLPMMITVVLSSNMKRMLRDKVLVRKLVGIETSGSLNILFTDKTGTLTKGNLQVTGVLTGDGGDIGTDALYQTPLWKKIYLHCRFGSASSVSKNKAIGGNTTDRAVLNFALAHPAGVSVETVGRIPFDSAVKYSAVQLDKEWYLMGAAEIIAAGCSFYFDTSGQKRVLVKERVTQAIDRHAAKGERVLALAVSDGSPEEKGLFGMTLTCLLIISDQVRPEVKPAVQRMKHAGVQVVMVTGDNKKTAAAIAEETGILSSPKHIAVTSRELSEMSDEAVKSMLPRLRVVARAKPADKSRLVRLSEELGLVAGMTGDGVNDAPALKKADVGFVMGSGTEIAKEAGDIVILDDNFASIVKAVLYGRTIFKSIRKFIVFQLTMNFCAVGVSIIAPFIGIESPVTVIQMLWINIIMDTLAGLAFAGEAPLREYMEEPPKRRDEPIINKYMYNQIGTMSVFTVALCLGFLKIPFFADHFSGQSDTYFMTVFFSLFVFSGVLNAFNARTNRLNLLAHIGENRAFITIMALTIAVQIGLIYFGGSLFRTEPLSLRHILWTIVLAFLVIPVDLARKAVIRKFGKKGRL